MRPSKMRHELDQWDAEIKLLAQCAMEDSMRRCRSRTASAYSPPVRNIEANAWLCWNINFGKEFLPLIIEYPYLTSTHIRPGKYRVKPIRFSFD